MREPTLNRTIREHFPHPIARAWTRYVSKAGTDRELAGQTLFEMVMRVLGAYLLADALVDGRGATFQPKVFGPKPSMGERRALVQELCRDQPEEGAFFAEARSWYFRANGKPHDVHQWCEAFVQHRNKGTGHSDHDVPPNAVAKRQKEQHERLCKILSSLVWLCDYRLIWLPDLGRSRSRTEAVGTPRCWMGAEAFSSSLGEWAYPRHKGIQDQVLLVAHHQRGLLELPPLMDIEKDKDKRKRLVVWTGAPDGVVQLTDYTSGHTAERQAPTLAELFDPPDAEAMENRAARRIRIALKGHLGAPPALPSDPFLPPAHRFVETLGTGGMAEVVRAVDTSMQQEVAVKFVLLDKRHGPEAASLYDRLRREATLLDRLVHKSIIRGSSVPAGDGTPTLRMRAVLGGDVQKRLLRGIDPEQALAWMGDLLDAVAYLHGEGIVHRDIKPSNILLDREDRPTLIDFGLARDLNEHSDLTQHGQMVGTPRFCSPEQERGDSQPYCDVYALGLVFLLLLKGKVPKKSNWTRDGLLKELKTSRASLVRDLLPLCRDMVDLDCNRRPTAAEALARLQRWKQSRGATRSSSPKDRQVRPATGATRSVWWQRGPSLRAALGDQVNRTRALHALQGWCEREAIPIVDTGKAETAVGALMDWRVRAGWSHSLTHLTIGELVDRVVKVPWAEDVAMQIGNDANSTLADLRAQPASDYGLRPILRVVGRRRETPLDEVALLRRIWQCGSLRSALETSEDPELVELRRFVLGSASSPNDADALKKQAWETLMTTVSMQYSPTAIRKSDGRVRMLQVPNPTLAHLQREIGEALGAECPPAHAATAFLPARTAALHATLHAGAEEAVVVDLKDFFGTTYPRHLAALWNGEVLPGERDQDAPALLDGWTSAGVAAIQKFCFRFDAKFRVRSLPQGAPSSPTLANLAAYALDDRLHQACSEALRGQPWMLSRYADDIVVSSTDPSKGFADRARRTILQAISEAGWKVATRKTRTWVRDQGVPLVLCGLVVADEGNAAPQLTRTHKRRVRAALHTLSQAPKPLPGHADDAQRTTHTRARGLLAWAAGATADLQLAAAASPGLAEAVLALAASLGASDAEQQALLSGWLRNHG